MKKILTGALLLTIVNICIYADTPYVNESAKLSKSEIEKFKRDLNSNDDLNRTMALMALSEVYKRDTKFWIEQTKNRYPEVRSSAFMILWDTQGNESIKYTKAALSDKDNAVIITAVWILGESKDPSILPLLVGKTKHNNPNIRAAAISSFKNFPPTEDLINLASDTLLKDSNSRVRWASVFYLRDIREDKYRKTLINSFFIKAVMQETETDLKGELIKCIRITDARTLDLLASFLTDKDIAVRLTAIERLGYMPMEFKDKSVDLLAPIFKDPDPRIRAAAVKACTYLDIRKPLPYIIEALNDKDENVRLAATKFFQRSIRDKSAVPALIERLKDENHTIRVEVVTSLKEFTIGNPNTSFPVQVSDPRITDALLDMLDREKDPYIIKLILSDFANFKEKRATSKITELLKSEDSSIRDAAVYALGEIMDESSVSALIEQAKDKNSNIARHAIEILGNMGDSSAIPVIELGLENKETKDASIIALLKMQSPKAQEYILSLLKSNDDAKKLDALDKLDKATSDLFDVKAPEEIIIRVLGEDQIRHALFYLTDDKNVEIRRKAFGLIQRLVGYIDIGRRTEDPHPLRETLIQELIPVILKGLNDPDEEIQRSVLGICFFDRNFYRDYPNYWKRRLHTSEISKAVESKLNSPNQHIIKMADEVIKSMNNDKSSFPGYF